MWNAIGAITRSQEMLTLQESVLLQQEVSREGLESA